jgi:hypothetical protein
MVDNLIYLVSDLKKENQRMSDALKATSPETWNAQKLDECKAILKNQSERLTKLALPGHD